MKTDVEQEVERDEEKPQLWEDVIGRRSFLRGLGTIGIAAPLVGTAALLDPERAFGATGALPAGDVAILRFLAAAEIIETDIWEQYDELGGVNGGNAAYIAALQNLDGDMPQYITDNTDDERSHELFLNAYLESKGAQPVNLDAFRTLPSTRATGAKQVGRLTNLEQLSINLGWYTRYRSELNPDLGAKFNGPFTISNQPAVPISDADTPPDQTQPNPPGTAKQRRMQAIANTAGFHFAWIEQGGSSLYPTLALNVTDAEVLKVVLGIGGVEIDHFGLWHDKAGNAVNAPLAPLTDPETGLTFPNLNDPATELTQTNKILPEPCQFIRKSLPKCSVIRPMQPGKSGAVAAANGFVADGLFRGQSQAFFNALFSLALAADAAVRGC